MFMFSRNRFGCTPFCCSLPWGGGRDVQSCLFLLIRNVTIIPQLKETVNIQLVWHCLG